MTIRMSAQWISIMTMQLWPEYQWYHLEVTPLLSQLHLLCVNGTWTLILVSSDQQSSSRGPISIICQGPDSGIRWTTTIHDSQWILQIWHSLPSSSLAIININITKGTCNNYTVRGKLWKEMNCHHTSCLVAIHWLNTTMYKYIQSVPNMDRYDACDLSYFSFRYLELWPWLTACFSFGPGLL